MMIVKTEDYNKLLKKVDKLEEEVCRMNRDSDNLANVMSFKMKLMLTNGYGIVTNRELKQELYSQLIPTRPHSCYGNIVELIIKSNLLGMDYMLYLELKHLLELFEEKQKTIDKYCKDKKSK